jgi:hypothetical protein
MDNITFLKFVKNGVSMSYLYFTVTLNVSDVQLVTAVLNTRFVLESVTPLLWIQSVIPWLTSTLTALEIILLSQVS